MDIALTLIANIIPLYILIALGFVSGKWLEVNLPSMATVAIYILAPFVNFGAMTQLDFTWHYILLPIFLFSFSGITGMAFYLAAHKRWKNNSANLIGMGSVSGNTGYFGLPLVLVLFGPEWAGLYLFMSMSVLLNEIGLGYYFGARGGADVKGAVMRVLKLPVIYGIALGLIANLSGFAMPDVMARYWTYASGAWVIIGMMLIGVALSKMDAFEFDWRLMRWLFTAKFLVWPLGGFAFVLYDLHVLHAFDAVIHQMILIFTAVPLAGNLVAYAATLNLHPERAATAVLASTLFGIITVPAAFLIYPYLS
jgi:hypothetical protein